MSITRHQTRVRRASLPTAALFAVVAVAFAGLPAARRGRPARHHDADRLRAVQPDCPRLHAASGARARCWPSRRTTSASSCRASTMGWPRRRRTADLNIAVRSPTTTPPRWSSRSSSSSPQRSARWLPRQSIPASLSHSLQEIMWSGGYVGTIVPPPATVAPQRPAIRDRQGAGRRGGRLHQRQARRQGERRPAHPGSDRVSGAAIRGDARRPQDDFPASPSSPTSRPTRSTRRAASRR